MRLQKYLIEAIINIDKSDVEMILKPLKPWIKRLRNAVISVDFLSISKFINDVSKIKTHGSKSGKYLASFSSGQLKSPLAKEAHKIKPITIHSGFPGFNNAYDPVDNDITVGLPIQSVNDLLRIVGEVDKRDLERYHNEFTEDRVRASIRHELTHWIDDCIHNLFLNKKMIRAREVYYKKEDPASVMKGKKSHQYLTAEEINAAIGSIEELKRNNKDEWDGWTFDDILNKIPPLKTLDATIGQEWRVAIKKRMAREKLLGKKMK